MAQAERGTPLSIAACGFLILLLVLATSGCGDDESPTGPGVSPRLVFVSQPSDAIAGVALSPAVRVAIRDESGNTVTDATDPVTLELASNPGNASLQGTVTVNAVAGIATFSDLVIERAAAGYVLRARRGADLASSADFAIAPAAAVEIVFALEPTASEGAAPINPAAEVAVQDEFGNPVSGATNVTVALSTITGGGTLSGTLTVSPVDGVAVFDDLSIDLPGEYALEAIAGALSATSATFEVHLTFVSMTAGRSYTCGVTIAAAAYCWGINSSGQLGDGTTTDRTTPALVSGGLRFASLSAGRQHACGVTTAGAAYCWGENGNGRLGDGTETDRTTPVAVSGGLGFASVSGGTFHTCGVTTADIAYCWGGNFDGQLGDGTETHRMTPVAVSGGLGFASVRAGNFHSCGVTTGDIAYCWGYNGNGQLGDGTTTDRMTPVAVSGGLEFASVSAAWGLHSCGVSTAAAVYCWGHNADGQLGDGTITNRTTPALVSGGLTFTSVTAGISHTCGFTNAGVAYCWGFNGNGRIGDGTTTDRTTPALVSGGLEFGSLSAGTEHTCGATAAGGGYCWGANSSGQLGEGTTIERTTPTQVVQ
jgi:alpha-tubulin suppressor-like RCC1 family protein